MKHNHIMFSFARCCAVITMCVLAISCGSNETTRKDGRVHVAAGTYVDARLILDENSTPWIIATREESERTVEIMSFDGRQKCTAATLQGNDVELLGSSGYAGADQRFYLSVLDSGEDVGTLSFVHADCTRAALTLDDVRAPTLRVSGTGFGGSSSAAWVARTSNGDLHVLNPWDESDVTIDANVTGYTVLGATVWYLANQNLVGWSILTGSEIARFGTNVSEASVGYANVGYVILYLDQGDVYVTSTFGSTPSATRLTTSGDACDVHYLGGSGFFTSWKSPCVDNTLNVSGLDGAHPFSPFILPGPIGDAVYRDGHLHWVVNPGTSDHALMTATIDDALGEPHRIGPGEDLGSIQRRPNGFGVDEGIEESDPDSMEFFVTLEAEDGSNTWGVWSVTNGFRQLEENVGTTRIFRFTDSRAEFSIALISTNEENGSGDLNVRSTITDERIATVPDARIDTIAVPFQSAAVTLLQNWNASTETGDLVGVGFDGTPLELERGVSMYTTIEIPLDALLYTIPFGDRRGVWMWIGGGPN